MQPDLAAVFRAQGDWCEEHGVPESQCLACNPKLTFSGDHGASRRAAARARLATAEAARARERQLAERGISARRSAEEAEQELAAAQAVLDAAGAAPGGSGGHYVLRAPFAGTVVARQAVAGMTAAAGEVLV